MRAQLYACSFLWYQSERDSFSLLCRASAVVVCLWPGRSSPCFNVRFFLWSAACTRPFFSKKTLGLKRPSRKLTLNFNWSVFPIATIQTIC